MEQKQINGEAELPQSSQKFFNAPEATPLHPGVTDTAASGAPLFGREELMRTAMASMASAFRLIKQAVGDADEGGLPTMTEASADIITEYPVRITFFKFAASIVSRLHSQGKFRTAEAHRSTLESFKRFREYIDLMPYEIDSELIEDYNVYLRAEGLCPNTISFYNRVLRACYNRAVGKGLTPQRQPFQNVYTGLEKTAKRAISMKAVRRIKALDLTDFPNLAKARDLFLFSFYTRGMSFIDMAYLKKSDISRGILSYRRRKTGQQLFIKWEWCMQEVVNRYGIDGSPYLLPIITSHLKSERLQISSAQRILNIHLKKVGRLAKVGIDLTMYVSRHSWASIARNKRIPLSIISEGMGHDSEATTRIYLSRLDASLVDEANGIILSDL